jgi:hypothetical protein
MILMWFFFYQNKLNLHNQYKTTEQKSYMFKILNYWFVLQLHFKFKLILTKNEPIILNLFCLSLVTVAILLEDNTMMSDSFELIVT